MGKYKLVWDTCYRLYLDKDGNVCEHNETEEISKLRNDPDLKLPAYAWPGGYPMYYLDEESNVLCPDCANDNDNFNAPIVSMCINYEEEVICEHCNKKIETAYI